MPVFVLYSTRPVPPSPPPSTWRSPKFGPFFSLWEEAGREGGGERMIALQLNIPSNFFHGNSFNLIFTMIFASFV